MNNNVSVGLAFIRRRRQPYTDCDLIFISWKVISVQTEIQQRTVVCTGLTSFFKQGGVWIIEV